MKIRYSKGKLLNTLKVGLGFLIIGLVFTIISFIFPESDFISYASLGIGQMASGVLMLMVYVYERKKQYLTIENGIITKHSLFGKKVDLNESINLRVMGGEYTFLTSKGEITVDSQIMDDESLINFKNTLKKYTLY